MAGGNISPRQKMINMMYLVLTALLALNVSKEVLDSFFEVNVGIERTIRNFSSKNSETYSDFDKAVGNNKLKYQQVRDKAFSIKAEADSIIAYIQEMKYELVFSADKGQVYLGDPSSVLDTSNGKIISDMVISIDNEGKPIKFSDLSKEQKGMPIAYLKNKSGTHNSGDLFYPKVSKELKKATVLKEKLIGFSDMLTDITINEDILSDNIKSIFDIDKKFGKKKVNWQEYNFRDMPSVGALTILSKIQSDVRNSEADVIDFLKRDIDAKTLKFTSAEGLQVPKSNFVLMGDSFRSEIFISAKNPGLDPEIYVGEYDSIGIGEYEMRGEYETVKVVNGKGMFARRATSEGNQKWGGLISMKTETGTKQYPFSGEYLVAAKTAVVSPTAMNVLYIGLESYGGNPLQVSVPGYSAGEISVVLNGGGKVKATSKIKGQWAAYPTKVGKAIVSLFVDVDGKRTKMGDIEFRVMKTPPPSPFVNGMKNGRIDRSVLLSSGGVLASLENFVFDGLKYYVTSFKLSGMYEGEKVDETTKKGMNFTKRMRGIISNSKSLDEIQITKIKAKLIGSNDPAINISDLVIEIK